MHCRILNIGPDSGVRDFLGALVQAVVQVRVQHIETGFIALEVLSGLPESELPHIVIIPFRLPVLNGVDFISGMRSNPHTRSIPILVWGPEIPEQEIDELYRAGAACVLLGEFDLAHLEAVRRFCDKCIGGETATIMNQMLYAPRSASQSSERTNRNARLGTLFVWSACLAAGLWICSLPHGDLDLTPLPVYASLAGAGFSLMWGRPNGVRAIP